MSKTMMLAKTLDEKKLKFPLLASRKWDGVPVRLETNKAVVCVDAVSRQGKYIYSIDHIKNAIIPVLQNLPYGSAIIGELTIDNTDFKDISGKVRRNEPCQELILCIFDVDIDGVPYAQRMGMVADLTETYPHPSIRYVTQHHIPDMDALKALMKLSVEKDWEGIMLRNLDGMFEVGKRSWDMQKWKPEPTADLRVVSFEEAVSKEGTPLGRVGRINCEYKDIIIGVGAGKMKHTEAEEVWYNQEDYIGKLAEVKYMKDDSYDALRQPTFQRWRDDKDEPNFE